MIIGMLDDFLYIKKGGNNWIVVKHKKYFFFLNIHILVPNQPMPKALQ